MSITLDKETIQSTIYETLAPKLGTGVLIPAQDDTNAKNSFEDVVKLLPDYIFENYSKSNILSIDFIKWLHRLLYPEGTEIVVFRDWKYHYNLPWEWRSHNYEPQISFSYWSAQSDVEKDLANFTDKYYSLQEKKRTDILRYYFDFLRVHPFGDSNLTVISIICDLECKKYWFEPFNMLNIRFKDRQFLLYCLAFHEKNIHKEGVLQEILTYIDDFHNNTLSDEILREKNKQIIFSTSTLVDTKKNIEYYLTESYILAETTYSSGNYPIGSILLVDWNLKIEWQNKVITQKDASWHSEIDIIKKSEAYQGKKHQKILFVTLEPCNNCAKALCEYGVDEVYYILEDPSWGGKDILERAWVKVYQIKYRYDEYLDLMIEFMKKHGWYNEVLNQFISIKENGRNTYREQIENTLLDRFINVPNNLVDYEIRKVVYNNTLPYLKSTLLRTSQDQHSNILDWYHSDTKKIVSFCYKYTKENTFELTEEFISKLHPHFEKEWKQYLVRQVMQNVFYPYFLTKSQEVQEKCRGQFEQHMEILTKYAMDGYINNPTGLTTDFIRGIHKNIYGGLTRIKVKTTLWEGEYMTPGEFKTKQNGISRLDTPGVYLACTPPEKVVEELQKLLSFLHEWNGYIYKKVIQFFLTFTEIHPFPDDNGKIGLILADLILIKNDLYPFFISSFKRTNKKRFYEMIQEYSHGPEKDMIPFYIMIGESYAHICEEKWMTDFLEKYSV